MYPDAQEMLDNLSKTREFWHDQIKCASPPLSENEPEGEDPGNIEDNERLIEGASSTTTTTVAVPKTITEESSMNSIDESDLQSCPVDDGDADTCSLQSSTDSLANMKRYVTVCKRGVKERKRGGGRE